MWCEKVQKKKKINKNVRGKCVKFHLSIKHPPMHHLSLLLFSNHLQLNSISTFNISS